MSEKTLELVVTVAAYALCTVFAVSVCLATLWLVSLI